MKTVLITGGNRGLGKGFSTYFLHEGFTVLITLTEPDKLDQDFKNNPQVIPLKLDVSDDLSIKSAYETTRSHVKHLDFLINNAGVNKETATNNRKELVSTLASLDRTSLQTMFNINAISPILIVKEFLPLMTPDPSFVINISSARSSFKDENENTSGNYGYRASKAALNLMTFASLNDLPKNVRTFAVHPGNVKTDMNPRGTDSPSQQAQKIIEITHHWQEEWNGKFLRFSGELYPL